MTYKITIICMECGTMQSKEFEGWRGLDLTREVVCDDCMPDPPFGEGRIT